MIFAEIKKKNYWNPRSIRLVDNSKVIKEEKKKKNESRERRDKIFFFKLKQEEYSFGYYTIYRVGFINVDRIMSRDNLQQSMRQILIRTEL